MEERVFFQLLKAAAWCVTVTFRWIDQTTAGNAFRLVGKAENPGEGADRGDGQEYSEPTHLSGVCRGLPTGRHASTANLIHFANDATRPIAATLIARVVATHGCAFARVTDRISSSIRGALKTVM